MTWVGAQRRVIEYPELESDVVNKIRKVGARDSSETNKSEGSAIQIAGEGDSSHVDQGSW